MYEHHLVNHEFCWPVLHSLHLSVSEKKFWIVFLNRNYLYFQKTHEWLVALVPTFSKDTEYWLFSQVSCLVQSAWSSSEIRALNKLNTFHVLQSMLVSGSFPVLTKWVFLKLNLLCVYVPLLQPPKYWDCRCMHHTRLNVTCELICKFIKSIFHST